MKKEDQVKVIIKHLCESGSKIDVDQTLAYIADAVRYRCVCSAAVARLVAQKLKQLAERR